MKQTRTNTITMTWENVANAKGAKDTDIEVLLLFDLFVKFVASFTNAGKRTDGQTNIILTENTGNKKIYSYLCFINEAVLADELKP